ncbi:putative exported cysteine proteinase [metagenome]|uniref:Putative exported cysteine proteinase n=1 Tax=metagenome TaxID=256318 RepID=A0A2P2BW21_9ZZZZ
MLHGRKRATLALTAAATIVCVALVPMSPSSAEPDIDVVKVKVDRLYEKAEHAQERLNDARVRLADVTKELDALRADQARQQDRVDAVRTQVSGSIVDQYQGESISAVGQVVVSDDPAAFLEQLTTMSAFNDMQSEMFGDYAKELKALNIRKEETNRRVAEAEALQKQLTAEKATVDENYDRAKGMLDDLEEEQQAAILEASRSGDVSRLPDVEASGRAAAAVQYAMAQVGKSYVYGAAGPSAFDCSGLTMMAWAQAGVGLPHSSSAQFSSGPRISESDLQPGDLVFYYSPISHVGMYIGNGLIVNAENPSAGVKVTGLHAMPYVGAVRPG